MFDMLAIDLPETVDVIATNADDARMFVNNAIASGSRVAQTTIWDGPIPPHSLEWYAPGVSMATPEYMMLRKTNQLPHDDAVMLCCALLSPYSTNLTSSSMAFGEVSRRDEPHTTFKRVIEYLMPIMGTPEARRCFDVMHEAIAYLPAYKTWCESRIID